MVCAKCHQNEAEIHLTSVMDGGVEEAVHLCKGCAPSTGFDLNKLTPEAIEALSVVGKKCEFCARDAFSGEMRAGGGATYWCFDCGLELAQMMRDLLVNERPDLLQRSKEESSFLSFCGDPELQEWSASVSERATQGLKEKRRQGGRGKGR
jgi:hypothetical protein